MKFFIWIGLILIALLSGGFFASLSAADISQSTQTAKGLYYCPMHPDYTSDKPGSCPICGMDLVKREVPVPADSPSADSVDRARGVNISFERQQLIGVKTGIVKVRPLQLEVRMSARVVLDQELYDAQKGYLGSDLVSTHYWNPARQRLLMLGMSEAEIADLRKRRWADRGLIAFVPSDSKEYYQTVYPDNVWVYGAAFENEAALIKPGQVVHLTAAAFPGENFHGVVAGVARTVDPQTRTVRVRIRVEDKQRRLYPEMFLTTAVRVDLGEKLTVPEEAVMDSGKRQVVYVVKDTVFEPRAVKVGRRGNGYIEVLDGVRADEKVAVNGNFLIDAESRLMGVDARTP